MESVMRMKCRNEMKIMKKSQPRRSLLSRRIFFAQPRCFPKNSLPSFVCCYEDDSESPLQKFVCCKASFRLSTSIWVVSLRTMLSRG